MVNWIMTCVTSTKFSICLNGTVHGYFRGGGGLRQGDSISAYLFTLVIEAFNLIMSKNIEESKEYQFHFGCKELKLSHMCFADDLLALCKESVEYVKCLGVPLLAKRLRVGDYRVLIDRLFKRFLWNSGDSAQGKAIVAWNNVCKPKKQGGLGLKDMKNWNEVLLVRQLWKILEDTNSLWAKWVNVVKLKGKYIWTVEADKQDSWG
uniref:uncharacterized protein LOC122588158 n=1 Tax=Erigeron canadensis TaxID=72917 RepID=UPI001CB99D75|nr:uncharacterized protein LOC122588158 [Erigeron canadensis]